MSGAGRVLNWGLLGTARISRAVIPPLRASARNRLAAVASRSSDRAGAYALEWGIDRAYGSYAELLADPEIDVVYSGEIEAMARAVIDGGSPGVTLEDSRGNTAAMVALYESARTGRPVSVR